MGDLLIYLIQECYGAILCVAIIFCFLMANKTYEKQIVRLFTWLCILVLIETIGGATERYIGSFGEAFARFYQIRHFLSWLCYVTGPAILLVITEIILRDDKKIVKILVVVPEVINILITSTTFFNDWCFTISPDNHWHPGDMSHIPQYMPVYYIAILLVAAFVNIRKSKWEFLIILVSSFFILIEMINEKLEIVPVNLRELTISIALIAYFIYFTSLHHIDEVDEINLAYEENEKRNAQELVDQCIETLAYTIDAKDKYTKGHSARVAKYSRMIGGLLGKSEEECRNIYLAGLLHDIGKISIADEIINKPGHLSDEEFAQIKNHPGNGAVILDKLKRIPFIKDGAKYHHERYDGKGYPTGQSGENIPELARIIAVADAYDAMTSYRSYRGVMDQMVVKQEIWKGMGTQFDPMFAKIMISLIDADNKYEMREKRGEDTEIQIENQLEEVVWPSSKPQEVSTENPTLQDTECLTLGDFICSEKSWGDPTDGILITENPVRVKFLGVARPDGAYVWCAPVAVLYSSEDGKILGPSYEELGVAMSAGYSWRVSDFVVEYATLTRNKGFESWDKWLSRKSQGVECELTAYIKDNEVYVIIDNEMLNFEVHFQFSQVYNKPLYISLTGEKCDIFDVEIMR